MNPRDTGIPAAKSGAHLLVQPAGEQHTQARSGIFRSLRLKLLVFYALVMASIGLLTSVYVLSRLHDIIEGGVDRELQQLAGQFADSVSLQEDDLFLIELTGSLNEAFSNADPEAPYYAMWDGQRELVDTSNPDMQIDLPDEPGARDRLAFREVTIRGPADSLILVGRSVVRERRQLREFATLFLFTTLTSISLALAAGAVLTQRALRPIRRIAEAAASVSASNLAQRIDVDAMEIELSDLAQTINDAFDRLQKSFDQQCRFRAHASHELRTPLAILLANAEFALLRERTPQDYQQALEAIQIAGKRMKVIIEGLLSLAQAESGQLTIRREPVDLCEVIQSTCSLLKPLAESRGIRTLSSCAAELTDRVSVIGDPDRLVEAATNLISNAIHYSDAGTSVEVRLFRRGSWIHLTVRNQGRPIPPADRPWLFTPFYRVEGSQQQHQSGCGLGLAITRWIAESHGGDVSFESDHRGVTTFCFRIPAAEAEPARLS